MSADDQTRILPGRTETSVGTQLSGIYELDERIASGGMGEVYRGHNIQTGDLVAIKIVLPEFARDQTILSLFRKEASILNHLSHEAVVRYHVFTVDPAIGRPYLAMEYVDGQSLFDMMRRGPMAPDDVRRLCHRLASGLSAVHRAGAIHRDLSPDNVILPDGRVERAKIIDFGIARSAKVGGETLIGGRFAGKYNYVSPEQLGLFGGEVSERSDIYSLGLVLAAALRGRPLDMTGSQVEVVEKRRSVPDLGGIDDDLKPIIEAMLQPDPHDRPASMAEIARLSRGTSQVGSDRETRASDGDEEWNDEERAARPWVGFESKRSARKENEPERFVEHVRPAHLSRPKPAAPKPSPREARRRRAPAIAIIGVLLLVAIGAGVGAYYTGYRPWDAASKITDEREAKLVPEPPAPQKEVAAAEPPVSPAPKPAPAQSPPDNDSEAQSPAVTGQGDGAAAPKAAAGAAPEAGLPASEIIKKFLEQAKQADAGKNGRKAGETAAVTTLIPPPPSARESTTPATPPQAAPLVPKPTAPESTTVPATGSPPPAGNDRRPSEVAKQTPDRAMPAPLSADGNQAANAPLTAASNTAKEENEASLPVPKTAPPNSASSANRDQAKADTPPASQPTPLPSAAETAPPAPLSPPSPAIPPPTPLASTPAAPPVAAETSQPESAGATDHGEIENSTPAQPPPPADDTATAPTGSPAGNPQETENVQSGEETVAMNVPKPSVPPPPANTLARTASWLRGFPGGDCFYAAPDDAGGKPFAIVGFGTAPDPFVKLMKAFDKEFGTEPDVQVRLIAPAQCAVTRFMHGFASQAATDQTLTLDRTSVPDGSPISGALRTTGGLRSNLLLIDHDGMTYNLDRLLVVDGDTAKFNARISLDAASRARGKPMPEIVLAITGAADLKSANVPQPEPAATVLPKIREEIQQSGANFSATAKYFQLGG